METEKTRLLLERLDMPQLLQAGQRWFSKAAEKLPLVYAQVAGPAPIIFINNGSALSGGSSVQEGG